MAPDNQIVTTFFKEEYTLANNRINRINKKIKETENKLVKLNIKLGDAILRKNKLEETANRIKRLLKEAKQNDK